MNAMESLLFGLGIIPVVRIDRLEDAVPLCQALATGGLPVAEITFRTPAAAESIRMVRQNIPDMIVGAGTVTSIALAQEALAAGAMFIVTPGFNPEVVAWCVDNNITVYPGCTTASEVEAAMNLGLKRVKFFPAEQSGGLAKIKALCAPYHSMQFMPTGGINAKNMADYLSFPKIFACGGSFMVPDTAIWQQNWKEITRLAREAVQAAQGLQLAKITLAAPFATPLAEPEMAEAGAEQGIDHAARFAFLGGGLEFLAGQHAEEKGIITYSAINVARSCRYLEAQGLKPDLSHAESDKNGVLVRVRIQEAISGFTLELVKR